MRPRISEKALTQAFEAATVIGDHVDPVVEVTDDGEVDDDPTLVMSRREQEILCQVCGK